MQNLHSGRSTHIKKKGSQTPSVHTGASEKNVFHTPHFLTGEELSRAQIEQLLFLASNLKTARINQRSQALLSGYHLALLFEKPSLRTRFSFTVAIRELGGDVIESVETTRKVETPEDQARVLSCYCHAIMVRTFNENTLERMSKSSSVPIINGLSNLHHPCQILADLLTLYEVFGTLQGLTLSYIGDGNNILHSLLLMAPKLGINIHYCCPPSREPNPIILKKSLAGLNKKSGQITSFSQPQQAVAQSNAVYTDVWTSMGCETAKENLFTDFQVNEALMTKAQPRAIFMHCMPMNRGKEVSVSLPDQPYSVVFKQSENRLHTQKALLLFLLKGEMT